MKPFFLTLTIFAAAALTLAQQTDLSGFSKTPKGQRILGYFAAFNSGDDEKLKNFFLENVTAESLKARSADARVEFHRQVRRDYEKLELKRIVSVSVEEVELFAQGKTGGWLQYTFIFDSNPPNKFQGWQIEQIDGLPSEDAPQNVVPATTAEFVATAEKMLRERVAEDKFSGVVLVARNDKPIFWKAYGAASRERKLLNKIDTKFNLGSINKNFTRVAIGQLVKQGKVSFDDKLGKYLPDYPNKVAREKVTIRHLVTMTSGIGDFFGPKFDATPKDKFRKNSDFIPLFAETPLAFEPGTNNQYSNGGYVLLGAIIEKVTGTSYYDYVRENIFKVAGMPNTDSYESDKIPANTASGYTGSDGQAERVNNFETRPYRGSAAGGGYSTAEDLLKYTIALKSRKLSIPDDNGQPRNYVELGIAGGADGINAILLADEKSGWTIVVLSNFDPPSAEQIGVQLRNLTKNVKQ